MHQFINIPTLFGFSMEVYLIMAIIAIPVFFFNNWLLKKWIKKERTRKIAAWVTTLTVTPVVYAGLILLLIYYITYIPSKDFTEKEWLTNTNERFQMADDIIESKILIGKDTTQVKQMLGDSFWSDNKWQQDSINTWTYDMGMGGGGLGFMFNHLAIKFKKEKVISVEHIQIRD